MVQKILLIGDFNIAFTEASTAAFCNEYKLKALNREPTCFKNSMSLSCIDLYLKNRPKRFESSLTIEAVLLDFQKLIVTALKVKHENIAPKIIQNRYNKTFDSKRFLEKILVRLLTSIWIG